jgi:hypothetical protein
MSATLTTPDLRYIVVRGRLWRRADPDLPPQRREALVAELMAARRAVGAALRAQRAGSAKTALGERGPVWWSDGAPDLNRRLARNTPYAGWYAAVSGGAPEPR